MQFGERVGARRAQSDDLVARFGAEGVVDLDRRHLRMRRQILRAPVVSLCRIVRFLALSACHSLLSFVVMISDSLDQPQRRNARRPLARDLRVAREVKMRCAIARTFTAGTTAKGDGFAISLAAMGITAIALFELDQLEMTRRNLGAAKRGAREPRENRRAPQALQQRELIQ